LVVEEALIFHGLGGSELAERWLAIGTRVSCRAHWRCLVIKRLLGAILTTLLFAVLYIFWNY
jgi:hypothetical protein